MGVNSYERGSQAVFIAAATTTILQVGQAAPLGSNVFGMSPSVSRGQLSDKVAVQVDGVLVVGDIVNLLGSLDGVNFYVIGTATAGAGPTGLVTAKGGIFYVSPGSARYLAASITTKGSAAAVTVSMAA